jgi:threonylcarbamoyladenosine tRNA methylthiotransferase MtaB
MESCETGLAYPEFGPVISQEDTRAYIKIEDGCDSFCSYCIIPYARGRVVSRLEEDVFCEAVALGNQGFREIVLTGIHICAYGKDRGEGIEALLHLLLRIDAIPTIHRIRLGSLEPNSITESFCAGLAQVAKLCPHFHVSLQSGSDSVLSRMNRKYDSNKYRECISAIRSYFPRVSITTDIIVAFPGETKIEHDESICFCEDIGFSRIHVFPFSPRTGTKAATMQSHVHPDIVSVRAKEFVKLSSSLAEQYAMTFAGEKVEVLLETLESTGHLSGYCKEYLRVFVMPSRDIGPGSEVKAIILSTNSNALYGTITD